MQVIGMTSILLMLTPLAQAQDGGFDIAPVPFVANADSMLVLKNNGTQPITLDSLAFDRDDPELGGLGWAVSVEASIGGQTLDDTIFCSSVPGVP